ncbi:ankyrin [Dothidotthia symphoricarpi CBS 119687]|uniref:Ankyrin n=1 Tax=Dothidotthia symphoricarpi CBS 119687 TaxID=1392245 RepID=A0A6A6AGY1_9PLEO|nr:ankyrin [Dothidotthia symphoricarpi CBS 119687]KAF2130174.1 ankyrin [Dothidotthia symphoricarpi CBS 119687]
MALGSFVELIQTCCGMTVNAYEAGKIVLELLRKNPQIPLAAWNLFKSWQAWNLKLKTAKNCFQGIRDGLMTRGPLLPADIHNSINMVFLDYQSWLREATAFTRRQQKLKPPSMNEDSIREYGAAIQLQVEKLNAVQKAFDYATAAPAEQRMYFAEATKQIPSLCYASIENALEGLRESSEISLPSSRLQHRPSTSTSWLPSRRPQTKYSRELIKAACNNAVDLMKHCINNGANIDHQSTAKELKDAGMAALHAATAGGHLLAVKLLVDYKANINIRMPGGYTALHLAVRRGYSEVVRFLINKGADLDATDDVGQTPLTESPNEAIQLILLDAGANPDIPGHDLNTALHYAASFGWVEAVRSLVNHRANIHACNMNEQTPLWLACSKPKVAVTKADAIAVILLIASASPNAISKIGGTSPFHEAIRQGRRGLLDKLIESGADTMSSTEDNQYPLHLAARLPDPTILEELCPFYQEIDLLGGPEGNTALIQAIMTRHVENVKVLVRYNASLTVRTEKGEFRGHCPLHHAFRVGVVSQAVILLKLHLRKRIPIQQNDTVSGTLPIHWAAHPDIVDYWVKAQGSVHEIDNDKNTPLHWLVRWANISVIKRLVSHEANVKARNKNGWIPIEFLCYDKRY